MEYFNNGQGYNQSLPGQRNPASAGFQDDFNGIVNGLTSTVQLGYTGVSLIYFYKTIKKFFNDYVKTILKQGKAIMKENNPKLFLTFLVKKTIEFFKFKTINGFVIRFALFFSMIVLIKLYTWITRKQVDLIEKSVEKKRKEKELEQQKLLASQAEKQKLEKTSEEFWQKYFGDQTKDN